MQGLRTDQIARSCGLESGQDGLAQLLSVFGEWGASETETSHPKTGCAAGTIRDLKFPKDNLGSLQNDLTKFINV